MIDENKLKECFKGDNFIIFVVLMMLFAECEVKENDDK